MCRDNRKMLSEPKKNKNLAILITETFQVHLRCQEKRNRGNTRELAKLDLMLRDSHHWGTKLSPSYSAHNRLQP